MEPPRADVAFQSLISTDNQYVTRRTRSVTVGVGVRGERHRRGVKQNRFGTSASKNRSRVVSDKSPSDGELDYLEKKLILERLKTLVETLLET